MRAPRHGQPPPTARRLRDLRRRLVRHRGRSAENPLARRARRPHDPPVDRRRATVGRSKPHLRAHRPGRRPRRHRPAHRRGAQRQPTTACGGIAPRLRCRTALAQHRERRPATTTEGERMTHHALLPSPALFDVSTVAAQRDVGTLERVALEHLELAPNKRRDIDPESIRTLAAMLARTGQLVPCIGYRPAPDAAKVVLCAGQRRLLAARASHTLAGTPGFERLAPVRSLIVLLLDRPPSEDEIRRVQAQENAREPLSLRDQQEQFRDCWQARAGLPEPDRMAVACADLGISTSKGHSLRRQLTLPDSIRARVAERPAGDQLSVRMAHRLAEMHDVAPELATAVAARVTTGDLHDQAVRDLGGFVHRTVVENDNVYAVRIDDGVLLDAAEQIQHARRHLSAADQRQAAAAFGCKAEKLDAELDALAARARSHALKLRVDGALRDRAANGRYAWTFDRGQDFAAGIWVIDPVFMLDTVRQQLADADSTPAREERYFAGTRLDDEDLRDAGEEDRERRAAERARHAEAIASNLGLGHDIRAALADPTDEQLHALREIACRLLCRHYPR